MIRRREVDEIKNPESEIVQLLRQGVENNWRFADKLMNYINTSKLVQIDEWWKDLGKAREIEGYVVHYWLLKNGYMLEVI